MSNLRRLLGGLAAGFLSGGGLAWWLTRYEPLNRGDYLGLSHSVAGEAELLYRIDPERLRQDTTTLASIDNRRSGGSGEAEARHWTLTRFRQAGLSRVHASPVLYPRWRRRGRSSLKFFTPAPFLPDFVALNGSAASPNGGIERPLVDLGRGSVGDYAVRAGRGLAGSVHLITRSREARPDLTSRAARQGAAAVILANPDPSPPGKRIIQQGAVCFRCAIPALAVSHEAGERLRNKLGAGRVQALLHVNVGYGPGLTANISGEIPGQRREYVVLAAHYDAWYAGAADNAAGLAALLELARAWTGSKLRPYRTIRFVAYGAGEEALTGSLFDVITQAPLIKARCRGVIAPSIVGAPTGALRLNSYPPALAQAAADLALEMGYSEATGYPVVLQEGLTHADHRPFARLKLPVLALSKGPDPFVHTPYDRAERLDYQDVRWTAALAGGLALRLAQR